ncbi:Importin beta-like protein [Lachnellula occidentalis]|uniref:Importin beta-like protein n=1 Tax=Lachnellula occidentalis TaxID=215460 RepID=A0A8H8UGL1_9HELO|nr:Importin beta-like protein [Lachnellula occidentalis]
MAGVGQDQLPASLEEVVSLIIQLYQPGAPETIAKSQETLQRLQRSPQGWQVANSLCTSKNENVRFFAALTFTVKLNTDAQSLGDEDVRALLQTLVGWLVRCVENAEGPLVMRKLCSTLVSYFLQFSMSWKRCVKHLMYCLCTKRAVPYDDALSESPDIAVLAAELSNETAIAIFWFASSLVEEVGKTDSSLMKQNKFHKSVVPNVDDIVPLLSRYLTNTTPAPTEKRVRQEAMGCYQAWVSYAHRAFIDDDIVLEPLQALIKPAMMCLAEDDLSEIAIELFSDMLTNYSKFLSKEDFELLYSLFNSPWAQERYQRLIEGDYDFDSLQFGNFMIAFGDATLQDLAKSTAPNSQSQQFLSALGGLLGAEGMAVHEDKIFVPALEFWNTFVENMIDDVYTESTQHPAWFATARVHVNQMIERCFRKIQFPPTSVFSSWDSADRVGFKDARRDFADMLQQYYLISGVPLLDNFVNLAHSAIGKLNWIELEAALYCLSVFPDCLSDKEDARDACLDTIFIPEVFYVFTNHENVPFPAVESFLVLIEAYADYFVKNSSHLSNALNFVFAVMALPTLSHRASDTITGLCSECRRILLPELGAFLQQYQNLARNNSITGYAKESVFRAIACLIQAIPDEESKIAPLDQLLNFVGVDIEECLQKIILLGGPQSKIPNILPPQALNSGQMALDLGALSLHCLAAIGRGLQEPNDKPVDLEKETVSPFWTEGNGARIQKRIFSMVGGIYDVLGDKGEIVEATCSVVRQGFREFEPGPFVLPPVMIAEILLKANPQTPRLGLVLSTAGLFISSYKRGLVGTGIYEVLDALLTWTSRLLQAQGEPSNDPEIAQNGIDFLARLLPKYLKTLMHHQPSSSLEFLFVYTLKALTGNDPLPKMAAADFFATFIGLPSQPDELQESMSNAIEHLGPMLAEALIFNIGGHAARSELDKLSEPLKKLVLRQAHSKKWIEAALLGSNFPSQKVTAKEKSVFAQKIAKYEQAYHPFRDLSNIVHSLRGARGTNLVVREFWLACRGSNFAYAS